MHQIKINFTDELNTQKNKNSKNQQPLKVASLFSGCGGMDLGFTGGFTFRNKLYKKNKYDIVFSNDIDIDAIDSYNLNPSYLPHKIIHADITNIQNEEIPDFDVLTAGFPCQPFSNAGKRQGVDDEYGRGTLWYECQRIIKNAIKQKRPPKAFVFENVRGIMSSKLSNGTTVPNEIKKIMTSLGYNVAMKLLCASDYGVPQNRYRFIIIGIRKDLPEFDFERLNEIVITNSLPNAESNPYELYLGSVLSDLSPNALQQKLIWEYSPQGQKMVDQIGPCLDGANKLKHFLQKKPLAEISSSISTGRSWKNINPNQLPIRFKKIYDDPVKYHAPNFYRRFALGEINGTITASAQPENCGITHPFYNRRFSVREAARIQSFPDDFVFSERSKQAPYKVIGNAVPPILAWVIARALEDHLIYSC